MSLAALFVQLLNGLASASTLFLIAAGLSLIFGVTRIVNFAHGSLFMLGSYIAYSLITRIGGTGLGYWVAVLLAAIAVASIGALIETLLLRRIYRAPELFQLLATFALTLIVQDMVLQLWGSENLVGPRAPGLKGAIFIFGRALPTYDLALILIGPAVLGALWLLLTRTRWGILIRAATQDRDMVAALGVNQAVLFTSVFALGAGLAGLGGALNLPREPANLGQDITAIGDALGVVLVGVLFAVSLHFIMGPGGMHSFGHAAYFGLGAYGAGLLFKNAGVPMELALVAAPIAGGLGALFFGWFCVRLSGVYLAMLTLAFAQIVWSIVFQWDELTGGSNGIIGVWPSPWLASKAAYFYLTLALCVAGVLFVRRILFAPFGYAMRAV